MARPTVFARVDGALKRPQAAPRRSFLRAVPKPPVHREFQVNDELMGPTYLAAASSRRCATETRKQGFPRLESKVPLTTTRPAGYFHRPEIPARCLVHAKFC